MTLETFLLTHTGTTLRNEDGIVCNIPDYYDTVIKPLEKRFKDSSFYTSRLCICCFHDDTDASLGLINHRFLTGVKIYHCFGCGASGTIIRMHQLVQDMYFGKKLTERDSCLELASMFNIPLDNFNELADDDYDGKYLLMLKRISQLKKSYSATDYSRALLEIRKSGVSDQSKICDLLGKESIKMIATSKRLYA